MSELTLEERKAFIATIPWVKRLKKPQSCEGFVASRNGGHCKNPGYWKFRHLKRKFFRPTVETQVLCWNHLFSRGIYGDMDEEERFARWIQRNPPPLGVREVLDI